MMTPEVKNAYTSLATEGIADLLITLAPLTQTSTEVNELFEVLSAEFKLRTLRQDFKTVNERIDVVKNKRRDILQGLRGLNRERLIARVGRSMRIHSITNSTPLSDIRFAILDAEASYGRLLDQREAIELKILTATTEKLEG